MSFPYNITCWISIHIKILTIVAHHNFVSLFLSVSNSVKWNLILCGFLFSFARTNRLYDALDRELVIYVEKLFFAVLVDGGGFSVQTQSTSTMIVDGFDFYSNKMRQATIFFKTGWFRGLAVFTYLLSVYYFSSLHKT